jgi:predicted dehydrogenase
MIRYAIVGCGGMANVHANVIRKIPQIQVAALVDIVPEKTRAMKEKHFPDAREYDSFEKLLAGPRDIVDAVLLVTPHTIHYPHAKAALEHGWHVLTEKPMVTSSEHAYDLWKTVNRTGKVFGIAFQSPYTEAFEYLARERDAGNLGTFQVVSAWLAQSWMRGTANSWRHDPALSGGGQMYDSGAHTLNALMWLINSPVVEVACFYDKVEAPVDINGVAIAKFQNGTLANIGIGGNCPPFRTEIAIQTDKFLISTDMYGGKLEMKYGNGRTFYPHVTQQLDIPGAGTPHLNFINAIEGKEPLRAPVRYGVLLSALMDAMYESADTGKVVRVKPVPERLG